MVPITLQVDYDASTVVEGCQWVIPITSTAAPHLTSRRWRVGGNKYCTQYDITYHAPDRCEGKLRNAVVVVAWFINVKMSIAEIEVVFLLIVPCPAGSILFGLS